MPNHQCTQANHLSKGYGSTESETTENASSDEDNEEDSPLLVTTGPLFDEQKSSKPSTNNNVAVLLEQFRIVVCRKPLPHIALLLGIAVLIFVGGEDESRHRAPTTGRGARSRQPTISTITQGGGGSSKPTTTTTLDASSLRSFGISPVDDMGMLSLERTENALPSAVWGNLRGEHPLPTNSWYLNLVSQHATFGATDQTRVYTVPYILDPVSPTAGLDGLKIHWPTPKTSEKDVQMVYNDANMLFLGAEGIVYGTESRYRVRDDVPLSNLGVGLEWSGGSDNAGPPVAAAAMTTQIVRGMPYVTMEYPSHHGSGSAATPTIYSYKALASEVQIDLETSFEPVHTTTSSKTTDPLLWCRNGVSVRKHLHLHFIESDFTWMIFFNKPVTVSCDMVPDGAQFFQLSVHADGGGESNSNLVVRAALLNPCTTGDGTNQAHCSESNAVSDRGGYESLLKAGAHVVPGSPTIDFEYSTAQIDDDQIASRLHIDWDASSVSSSEVPNAEPNPTTTATTSDHLMFALPHHQESLSEVVTEHCFRSFHGSTCLVQSPTWVLEETLGTPLSFFAPRPPTAELVPAIADALHKDLSFQPEECLTRGATDTYFSGKVLARMARVLVIAEELEALSDAAISSSSATKDVVDHRYPYTTDGTINPSAWRNSLEDSMVAAANATLPSKSERSASLDRLRKAVSVWLRSNAEAPYVYDSSWGGLVNCGCRQNGADESRTCSNIFPDCPALGSFMENFGNGYYNDHHYHYGYHVYAAAVVARFDPEWGREHFDDVMLYIRDFANPLEDDAFFPQYRQKDWYLGSSWASGIFSAENSPHGRNEESSSEAIAAYEGMGLFGASMVDAFAAKDVSSSSDDDEHSSGLATAKLVRDSGQLLAASELAATNRYWHVWSSDTHTNNYPEAYQHPVVGMLYDTMATFQTWFSGFDVGSYGIQLIPLTPVAETRDDPAWATELYPLYEKACVVAAAFCIDNGWSVLQAGLLATTGNRTGAVAIANALRPDLYDSNTSGNTLTNTLWYISTRKDVHA